MIKIFSNTLGTNEINKTSTGVHHCDSYFCSSSN